MTARPIEDCQQLQRADRHYHSRRLVRWSQSAKPGDELTHPSNELEINEDSDSRWRTYVNQKLAGSYQSLFEKIHMLLMLQAPGFEQSLRMA